MKRLVASALSVLLVGLSCLPALAQSRAEGLLDQAASGSNTLPIGKGAFTGSLLITPDRDWEQKWDTPPEVVPHFNAADEVAVGEPVTVLVFFSSPSLSARQEASISAQVSLLRPDGSLEIPPKTSACFEGSIDRFAEAIRLCSTSIELTPTSDDMKGVWTVRAVLKDHVSGATVPMEKTFRLR